MVMGALTEQLEKALDVACTFLAAEGTCPPEPYICCDDDSWNENHSCKDCWKFYFNECFLKDDS